MLLYNYGNTLIYLYLDLQSEYYQLSLHFIDPGLATDSSAASAICTTLMPLATTPRISAIWYWFGKCSSWSGEIVTCVIVQWWKREEKGGQEATRLSMYELGNPSWRLKPHPPTTDSRLTSLNKCILSQITSYFIIRRNSSSSFFRNISGPYHYRALMRSFLPKSCGLDYETKTRLGSRTPSAEIIGRVYSSSIIQR